MLSRSMHTRPANLFQDLHIVVVVVVVLLLYAGRQPAYGTGSGPPLLILIALIALVAERSASCSNKLVLRYKHQDD
jgi:hypothetical protein